MLYQLAEFERNMHDDSDFYAVVYDDEANQLRQVLAGTTRFACETKTFAEPTDEVLAVAEKLLAERFFEMMKLAEEQMRAWAPRPGEVHRGDELKLHRTVNSRKAGSFEKGLVGRVTWVGPNQFRTYYRNGYNRPEHDYRVGLEFADGRRHFFALADCRITKPMPTDDEIAARAVKAATNRYWLGIVATPAGFARMM